MISAIIDWKSINHVVRGLTGMVTVSRSIEMDDNSSVSLPVETVRAESGTDYPYTLEPPSDEDRREAERFRIRR